MKKHLIAFIDALENINEFSKSFPNPLHFILYLLIAMPTLFIYKAVLPEYLFNIAIMLSVLHPLLFCLKLFAKEHYQDDLTRFKTDLPSFSFKFSDYSFFHLFMFVLIAAPFLAFLYAILSAIITT